MEIFSSFFMSQKDRLKSNDPKERILAIKELYKKYERKGDRNTLFLKQLLSAARNEENKECLVEFVKTIRFVQINIETRDEISRLGQAAPLDSTELELLSDSMEEYVLLMVKCGGNFKEVVLQAAANGYFDNQGSPKSGTDQLIALRLKFSELPREYPINATVVGPGEEKGMEVISVICDVCIDATRALKTGIGVDGNPVSKQQISNGLKKLIDDVKKDLGLVATLLNSNGVQLYQQYLKQLQEVANKIC